MDHQARYNYAGPFKTYERAEDRLISLYAEGDVTPSEDPRIEKHNTKVASWDKSKSVYYITLPFYG